MVNMISMPSLFDTPVRIVINTFRSLPIISHLLQGDLDQHKKALREFGFTWAFCSFFPILIGIITTTLSDGTGIYHFTIADLMSLFFGQLHKPDTLIFAITLLGPATYVLIKYNKDKKEFFGLPFWYVCVIFIMLIALFVYQLDSMRLIKNEELMNKVCVVVYFGSLLLWYISILSEYLLESGGPGKYAEGLKEEENALKEQLKGFGRGKENV